VRVTLRLPGDDALLVEVESEGSPLRFGLDWVGRPASASPDGPAPHARLRPDGAVGSPRGDRWYTGEACPGELRAEGGIPQGDYAPVPWVLSSGGWGA